jgi:hypothetical protein
VGAEGVSLHAAAAAARERAREREREREKEPPRGFVCWGRVWLWHSEAGKAGRPAGVVAAAACIDCSSQNRLPTLYQSEGEREREREEQLQTTSRQNSLQRHSCMHLETLCVCVPSARLAACIIPMQTKRFQPTEMRESFQSGSYSQQKGMGFWLKSGKC